MGKNGEFKGKPFLSPKCVPKVPNPNKALPKKNLMGPTNNSPRNNPFEIKVPKNGKNSKS